MLASCLGFPKIEVQNLEKQAKNVYVCSICSDAKTEFPSVTTRDLDTFHDVLAVEKVANKLAVTEKIEAQNWSLIFFYQMALKRFSSFSA